MTTRTAVALSAALEFSTGAALIAAPGIVVRLLLGAGLDAGGIAVARLAGLALLSLSLACWPRADDAAAQPARALFTYNLLVAIYLGYLGLAGPFGGVLLWPAFALHSLFTLLLSPRQKRRAPMNGIASPQINLRRPI